MALLWATNFKCHVEMIVLGNLLYTNEPDESSPLTLYFLKKNFNIFLPSNSRSSLSKLTFVRIYD